MRTEPAGVHARLDAWRRQGADRVDPLRFAVMAALAQRALRHDGAVRERLDARLQALAEDYAGLLATPSAAMSPHVTDTSLLQPLLAALANAPRWDAVAPIVAARPTGDASPASAPDAAPPMPVLDEFRQLWGRIRIDRLLRECLDALPEDAGPLHSRVLTGRAMAQMREVSPAYLQHFIAYVDVLTWMEQLGGHAATGSEADEGAGPRKPARAGGGRRKKLPPDQP